VLMAALVFLLMRQKRFGGESHSNTGSYARPMGRMYPFLYPL
jgi:hypothetical protein